MKTKYRLIENFLNSGLDTTNLDVRKKFKYNLVNIMLLLAAFTGILYGTLHVNHIYGYNSDIHAVNCGIFLVFQVILILFLRHSPSKLNLVSYLLLFSIFYLITSNLIFSVNVNMRILWFLIFLTVADFLGGYKLRNYAAIAVTILLSIYLSVPGAAVNLSTTDIISSLVLLILWMTILNYFFHELTNTQSHLNNSEIRYRTILDSTVDGIICIDRKGIIESINPAIVKLFGYSSRELIGNNIKILMPKHYAGKQDSFIQLFTHSQIENKLGFGQEISAQRKDGKNLSIDITMNQMNINDEQKFTGVIRDITQRKNMEDEIRSSEQHLKLYREQAPMATIEWSTEFEVINWNKAAENMFGYTVKEVEGKNFADIMLPDDAIINIKELWQNLINQKGGESSINENLTKDGRLILCEWHNTALKDDSGKVIGAASIVQDITEREHQAEHIRRAQKMDALGKLTGGIAHDYNNMLGVIIGYCQLLEETYNQQEHQELFSYIEQISHAADRGSKLTKKLLSFTRHKSSNDKSVNINSLLKYEKDILEKTLTARIKLIYKLKDDLWSVRLDSSELEDVILNLSINAMHAINGNGQITIETQNVFLDEFSSQQYQVEKGNYVTLKLSDTGSGMDDVTQDRMFDPFYTTKGDKGTGLGLSQVYGFVQRSNGSINVTSKIDHGTEILLLFPQNIDIDNNNHTTDLVQSDKEVNLNGNEVILSVDDEPALLRLSKELLERYGYQVICAENGKQALEKLKNNSVDLLLSDVIMPEMDGYQLANEVQKLYPEIKIQLASGFSGYSDEKNINDNLKKNMLYKPFNSKKLLLNIRELLDN